MFSIWYEVTFQRNGNQKTEKVADNFIPVDFLCSRLSLCKSITKSLPSVSSSSFSHTSSKLLYVTYFSWCGEYTSIGTKSVELALGNSFAESQPQSVSFSTGVQIFWLHLVCVAHQQKEKLFWWNLPASECKIQNFSVFEMAGMVSRQDLNKQTKFSKQCGAIMSIYCLAVTKVSLFFSSLFHSRRVKSVNETCVREAWEF